ncbi:hypothetical protein M408DRAFT_329529 [Serendipita vermifera MAFF 305830]|uniref:Uncharacterized protein n=1 Tax=Serendipita vermifera MAFF 305830 TaxID=933852 RepID=A0A0C3AUB7_SERVB|nr:hypothetical protein M408DRAFT_329529 [Serendipita vermifera MAFF 305830]
MEGNIDRCVNAIAARSGNITLKQPFPDPKPVSVKGQGSSQETPMTMSMGGHTKLQLPCSRRIFLILGSVAVLISCALSCCDLPAL